VRKPAKQWSIHRELEFFLKEIFLPAEKILLLFAFSILLFSCSVPTMPDSQKAFQPKVIPAIGYLVPEEAITGPEIVPAGTPYRVKVNRKSEFPGDLNTIPAGTPEILKVSGPVINTPGVNGIDFPEQVKVINTPVLCKAPEVITVKDAHSRDINPKNFSSYNKLQGLRHDQVRSMTQDRAGCLWLGTDDGLTRFDGKFFSHFTTSQGLNNNLILTVCLDKNEDIWFGSFGGGITRYDGRNLFIYTVAEGLLNNVVNCIFEDCDGNMWIGTAGGVTKYDGTNFINYTRNQGLCSNSIRAITQDNSGRIWISSNNAGVSVYDGKSFSNYSVKEGLLQNNITSLFKDNNGHIWLGASSRSLTKFDGTNFIHYPRYSGLSNDFIRTMVQDNNGCLWIGTETEGLISFNGKYFIHYSDKEGLSSNMIRCSMRDRNGTLWFGTRGGGLNRYDGSLFTHFTTNEGLSNSRIMSILEDGPDNFWLGTYGGYVTKCTFREKNGINHRYLSFFDEKDGLQNSRIYSILKDRDSNIWFGTDGGGVSMFDGVTMTTYTRQQGLCSDSIRKIIEDRDGNLWFATYGSGVSKFDGINFYNYSNKQGLGSNGVLSLLEDSAGNIWFATGNGVTMFDGKRFIQYSKDQGIFNSVVYSILQDRKGNLWFGTAGDGVVKYDGKEFTEYSENKLANNDFVLCMLQDTHRNMWLGTRFGLSVIEDEKLNSVWTDTGRVAFKSFSYEDGFTGIGCNIGAMTESSDGTIWIGTNDRLTAFHPDGVKSDTVTPTLQLTGIQLFNENIPWAELAGIDDTSFFLHNGVEVGKFRYKNILRWSGLPEKPSFKYNINYLTFNYIAVSVTKNSKIRYQYKLEGFDAYWSLLTDRTDVSFGNLKPGDYVFKVKAINSDGYWSNTVSYSFSIGPPWWKTLWFYTVTLLLVIILIYNYIGYRLRRLKLDKEHLQARVNEQTSEITQKNEALLKANAEKDKFFSIIAHDLRSPFSVLLGFSERMAENLPQLSRNEIEELAMRIYDSATHLFHLLENLLNWARVKQGLIPFRPEEIDLNTIVSESVLVLLEQAKTKKIEIANTIQANTMVFADNNMIQTVTRNLVSNALKFSHPGDKIIISAKRRQDRTIEISVSDSGIGMNTTVLNSIFRIDVQVNRKGTEGEISTGLGLLLCKEFVEKHNGKIWAESEEGKGSVFYFTIPY